MIMKNLKTLSSLKNSKSGFTMVELLVAIAIIALLIVVAVYLTPARSVVSNTKAVQVAQNFVNLKKAVEAYFQTEDNALSNVQELANKKYISHVPNGFSIIVDGSDELGNYKVQIMYLKDDVDFEKVKGMLPDVEEGTSNGTRAIVYTFNVRK